MLPNAQPLQGARPFLVDLELGRQAFCIFQIDEHPGQGFWAQPRSIALDAGLAVSGLLSLCMVAWHETFVARLQRIV